MKEKNLNKQILKKGIIIYITVALIISICFNLFLTEKIINHAYDYQNDVLKLDNPIIEIIYKDNINSIINELEKDSNGKFTGERINGKKEGKGTFVWNDGSVYEGEFSDDKINGLGKLTIPGNGSYEGNFVNGKKSGNGTYIFPNGDKYVGSWVDDLMSGYGVYTFSDGDKYEGQFANNKFHGQGTYTSGYNKYTGTWINNEYQK